MTEKRPSTLTGLLLLLLLLSPLWVPLIIEALLGGL